jgi:magnesium chelatase subunit D
LALANRTDLTPLLVVLSDGRATAAPDGIDPDDAARRAAEQVRRDGLDAVVIDAETGPITLGRAETLAGWMGARHLHLPTLEAETLRTGLDDLLR